MFSAQRLGIAFRVQRAQAHLGLGKLRTGVPVCDRRKAGVAIPISEVSNNSTLLPICGRFLKIPLVWPLGHYLSKVSLMSFSQLFQRPFFARSSHPVVDKAAKSAIEWYAKDHDKSFVLLLTFTTFMTIWPWVFFGIVVGLDGVAMPHRAAKIANDHPQDVSFFVTSISNTLSFVVGYLFTAAVSRLAQKYIVHKDPSIAHVSFFTNLKNRSFPMTLFNQGRLRPLLTVVLYMLVFNFVTSGISALLTPVIFNRHAQLQATELNFGATDPACVAWFNNNTISHQCDWTVSSTL